MDKIAKQLELLGVEETIRQQEGQGVTPIAKRRLRERVKVAHEIMSELTSSEDLAFLHSGLCQTCLPHSRPALNHAVWRRSSGRFSLIVTPGIVDDTPITSRHRQPNQVEAENSMYVGVPYGPKARLILIHLQTEGLRSRTVSLGPSLSAFMRSLGLQVTGGAKGSIAAIKEQCLRIAQCSFTMQWQSSDADGERRIITNSRIVDGLELWADRQGQEWTGTVELSHRFHDHLREHAVPLDKRGISHLSGNSLGLDLYALLAYRLPRLSRNTHLHWESLQTQIGADYADHWKMGQKIREVMPDVLTAYPHAGIEITRSGLLLKPSKPAVPRTVVSGFQLIEGQGRG